ncbi:esterase-like activity of phytase family protein [Pararhodobacter marinus]|nr:esterase-like activity of phytase family protein [Pararhodobacter marinus]
MIAARSLIAALVGVALGGAVLPAGAQTSYSQRARAQTESGHTQSHPDTYYAGVVQHQPASIPAAQVVARYRIPLMSGGINDFSGIATSDGTNIYMVSDHGFIVAARLQRGYGQSIDGMQIRQVALLRGEDGRPLSGSLRDAEGLSIGRDGAFYVSFEQHNRVLRYPSLGSAAQSTGMHHDFERLRAGSGLQSVAVDPSGRIYSIPKRAARATYGFPSYMYTNGSWTGAFRIPSDGHFYPVSADFGPDGALYILEQESAGRGYRSQVRRFRVNGQAISEGQWVMRSEYNQFGNLEGLAVFRDWNGRIRLLMVSDDDLQRGPSELIDVAVNR